MAKKSPVRATQKKRSKTSAEEKNTKEFLVVGIVVSPGGETAARNFFAALPPKNGMTFVVFPENSAGSDSDGFIKTKMPVSVVNEKHKIKPERVYLIPPERNFEITDGYIHPVGLNGREDGAAEDFFQKLDSEYGERAVCFRVGEVNPIISSGLKFRKNIDDAENDPAGFSGEASSSRAFPLNELTRAEKDLRISAEHFSSIINQITAGIAETDLSGRFTFVSNRFTEITGYTRDELLSGMRLYDITHPNDLPRNIELFERCVTKGEPFVIEKRYIRKNGTEVWVNNSVSPEYDAQRNLRFVTTVTLDITERKRAEEALRKSEEHLNLILESTVDYAIITFDLDGLITRWNKGAEKIFGFTEAEAIGQKTHLIFTPEDRAANVPEKEILKTLKNGRAEDERWHLRKNGSRFFASGVMQLLRDDEIGGYVKICRDETARLKAEKALRDKDLLAQLVSAQEDERRRIARDLHDHLGQQLTSLRLKLETLREMKDGEAVRKGIEEAQITAEQLDRDVDFLAWELRPAALDDLGLRATLGNFLIEWARYSGVNAEFHTRGISRARLAFEVETNLYRIAQEALNNIFKHARAANVSVLLEKQKDSISMIIEDDGIGFNAKGKTNRSKGIGLIGMSERAKLLGGTFTIESAKSKGTTIFVRVPVGENPNRKSESSR